MRNKYFRKYDIIIYSFIVLILLFLGLKINKMEVKKGSKVEVYVDNELKHIYSLQTEKRIIEIETNLGGVTLELENDMARVTKSYSPKKLIVKQGWISDPGETLIGIPDRTLIKIVGEEEIELDSILK